MSENLCSVKPVLKTGESSGDGSDSAYIYFDELVDISGIGQARIRIDFANKSFDYVEKIRKNLKDAGLTFTIQKP